MEPSRTKFNSKRAVFLAFSALVITGLLSSCSTLIKMMGVEDPRQEALDYRLEKIHQACKEGHGEARSYEAKDPESRQVGDAMEAGSLKSTIRNLELCRETIAESASATLTDSAGDKIQVVEDVNTVRIELNGSNPTLVQAYRETFELEKKLISLPIDTCMQKDGNLSQKGFGGTWEPLKLSLSEWSGGQCRGNDPTSWSISSDVPRDIADQIKRSCPNAAIHVPDFGLEPLSPQLARKWSTVLCQQAKTRKTGAAALSQPNTGNCEPCKKWITAR